MLSDDSLVHFTNQTMGHKILHYHITVRDREEVSIDVKQEVIYGLSNGENISDLGWPLKVEGQGQTLKTLMSNISKTVRDREKVLIDVK